MGLLCGSVRHRWHQLPWSSSFLYTFPQGPWGYRLLEGWMDPFCKLSSKCMQLYLGFSA